MARPPTNQPRPSFLSNAPPTTDIYTLSLHDALPISHSANQVMQVHGGIGYMQDCGPEKLLRDQNTLRMIAGRSEEHTSELQSRPHLVCRLLLEKKKNDQRRQWRAQYAAWSGVTSQTA